MEGPDRVEDLRSRSRRRRRGNGRCIGGKGAAVTWGYANAPGKGFVMEDAVAIAPEFLKCACRDVGGCCSVPTSEVASNIGFFGVYAGHGGDQVATYCARRAHKIVAEKWWEAADRENGWQRRWEVAFTVGFSGLDNDIIAENVASQMVGSCAVAVVLSGCQIITSNCGDSRAVICRGNQTIPLTVDHKPDNREEMARIEAVGGRVIDWNGVRVMGVLALSRAIGDRYMRPWIIPVPETSFTPRTQEDECLILASDGLWNVLSNEDVGNVACRLLRHQRRNGVVDDQEAQLPAQVVANYLVQLASNRNTSDNISVIVIDLKSKNRQQTRHEVVDVSSISDTG